MATPIRKTHPSVATLAAAINGNKAMLGTLTDPTHHHTSGAITVATVTDARQARFTAPIAADLTTIKAAADVANGTITIAAQPDYPRKLQVRIVDANSSISAGSLVLVGVGARGQAVTQTIALAGGTRTVTTDDAYATLTSGTVSGLTGAASGDTLGIGPATALGLPGLKTPVPTTFAVHKANVDNANETVGTVDATAGTIAPTTAANGTHSYEFWFTQAFVPTATAANTADAATGITVAVGGTSSVHFDASEVTVGFADLSGTDPADETAAITAANELKAVYEFHLADTLAHKTADAAPALTLATSLATAYTLVNAIYTDYNTHRASTTYHQNADSTNVASSTSASTLSTLQARANDLKTQLNAHMADAVAGASLRVVDA